MLFTFFHNLALADLFLFRPILAFLARFLVSSQCCCFLLVSARASLCLKLRCVERDANGVPCVQNIPSNHLSAEENESSCFPSNNKISLITVAASPPCLNVRCGEWDATACVFWHFFGLDDVHGQNVRQARTLQRAVWRVREQAYLFVSVSLSSTFPLLSLSFVSFLISVALPSPFPPPMFPFVSLCFSFVFCLFFLFTTFSLHVSKTVALRLAPSGWYEKLSLRRYDMLKSIAKHQTAELAMATRRGMGWRKTNHRGGQDAYAAPVAPNAPQLSRHICLQHRRNQQHTNSQTFCAHPQVKFLPPSQVSLFCFLILFYVHADKASLKQVQSHLLGTTTRHTTHVRATRTARIDVNENADVKIPGRTTKCFHEHRNAIGTWQNGSTDRWGRSFQCLVVCNGWCAGRRRHDECHCCGKAFTLNQQNNLRWLLLGLFRQSPFKLLLRMLLILRVSFVKLLPSFCDATVAILCLTLRIVHGLVCILLPLVQCINLGA